MNFNRLVKRYHVDVTELELPSDQEVLARKVDRIVAKLASEGQALPLEDFFEFGPIAKNIAEHEHRDRILALLLKKNFQPPVEVEDAEPDEAPLPPRREGGGSSRGGGSFSRGRGRRR